MFYYYKTNVFINQQWSPVVFSDEATLFTWTLCTQTLLNILKKNNNLNNNSIPLTVRKMHSILPSFEAKAPNPASLADDQPLPKYF